MCIQLCIIGTLNLYLWKKINAFSRHNTPNRIERKAHNLLMFFEREIHKNKNKKSALSTQKRDFYGTLL